MSRPPLARSSDGPGRTAVWLFAGAIVIAFFLYAFLLLPGEMIGNERIPAAGTGFQRARLELEATKDRDQAQSDVRTAAIQALGGIVVALGAYGTVRQFRLSRQAHTIEAFNAAIGHLQGRDLVARLGGIHALDRVARMSAYDQSSVVDVLATFVRDAARQEAPDRPAVQAAIAVLGGLSRDRDPRSRRVDLTETDLHGLTFSEMDLRRVNFTGSDLREARFFDAHLEDALFTRADVRGAALAGAWCAGASFEEAHLEGADVDAAHGLNPQAAHCGPGTRHA